jgi:drug/metabolite transporter (DMT)-like permease
VNEHTEQKMADETTVAAAMPPDSLNEHPLGDHASSEHPQKSEVVAFAIGVAGWLVPGLGHALQKMWGRAIGCFLTVGALVILGVGMRGNVFNSEGGDAFGMLGYVADLGTGSFYFVARAIEKQGSDVAHAEGDYGTRFLAAAGVLNLLAALHAYEAARGRKA